MMSPRTTVVTIVVCVVITTLLVFNENLGLQRLNRLFINTASSGGSDSVEGGNDCPPVPRPVPPEAAAAAEGGGTATSGKLFSGSKVASFDPKKLKFSKHREDAPATKVEVFEADALRCDHWSVVTTIFEPSEAVRRQVLLKGWCIVVVGDKKGPKDYPVQAPDNNFVFLTAAQQEELAKHFPVVQALPWNHFGRKNVGFLYAILHGARVIWDFDDDNMLLSPQSILEIPGNPWVLSSPSLSQHPPSPADAKRGSINGSSSSAFTNGRSLPPTLKVVAIKSQGLGQGKGAAVSFNPYPIMGAPTLPCWPRGLPLEDIKREGTNQSALYDTTLDTARVGVIQSLANHDPDMDAIFRLTMPIPFDFPIGPRPLVVPDGAYAPYNAQATLHLYSSLWSLLLPVTVHGRVSDIWRGYVAQRLGRDIGMKLLFSPPIVRQDRNSHNYLADFDSEGPLYTRAGKLISQLDAWQPSSASASLVARIEELWVFLYEHGYFKAEDVTLVQAWLQSLLAAGYQFPKISSKSSR